MPRTSFVHDVDGFAFVNDWDMRPGDWEQIRGVLEEAAYGLASLPALRPLLALPAVSAGVLARGLLDQVMTRFDPGPIGLCGGMSFLAADYYHRAWLPPRGDFAAGGPRNPGWTGKEEATLRRLLWTRLLDSLRGGVAAWTLVTMAAAMGLSPFSRLGGTAWARARSREAFDAVKAAIDAGRTQPVCIVGTSPNPTANHQVLVTGYEAPGPWGADSGRLYVYEPNAPGREHTIDFDFSGRRQAVESACARGYHGVRGPLVGFFVAGWQDAAPPPAVLVSDGLTVTCAPRARVGADAVFYLGLRNEGFGDTPPLRLCVSGRAGGAAVDPCHEDAPVRLPMGGRRTLARGVKLAAPRGEHHYEAVVLVEPGPGRRVRRLLPAASGTFASVALGVDEPTTA